MGPHYSRAAQDPRCRGASALLLGPSLAPLVAVLDVGRLAEGAVSGMLGRGYTDIYGTSETRDGSETLRSAPCAVRSGPRPPRRRVGVGCGTWTNGTIQSLNGTIAPRNENEIGLHSDKESTLTGLSNGGSSVFAALYLSLNVDLTGKAQYMMFTTCINKGLITHTNNKPPPTQKRMVCTKRVPWRVRVPWRRCVC